VAQQIGFPPSLVAYIQCLYTGGVTQIRVGCLLHSCCGGVRQGDPLSPLLFCAVIVSVLSQLDDRLGLELQGSVCINHLAFTDNAALVIHSGGDEEIALRVGVRTTGSRAVSEHCQVGFSSDCS